MTDGGGLVRSILAAPADDAPRLVYADWLDEHGRAEDAEFIRAQVELARLGFDGAFHTDAQGHLRHVPPHVEALTTRQLELWSAGHGRPDLPAAMADWPIYPVKARGTRVCVRRGFVERLSCEAEEFMAVAADLFARQPVVHVRLVDMQPVWDRHQRAHKWACAAHGSPLMPAHWLSAPLWEVLSERGPATYETADLADATLSWACVRYGRSLAGLT